MLSIQSLMNERPFFNEPGYEAMISDDKYKKMSDNYNDRIAFETLRVAVIGMLDQNGIDSQTMPEELRGVMSAFFTTNYAFYEEAIRTKMVEEPKPKPDTGPTLPYLDPFSYQYLYKDLPNQYSDLLIKLQKLKSVYGICDSDECAGDEGPAPGQSNPSSRLTAESYTKVKNKMISEIPVSQPKEPIDQEVWDDIDWTEEQELEPYEEEEEEGEVVVGEDQKDKVIDKPIDTRNEESDQFVDQMLDHVIDKGFSR